ncbi:MAG: type II toxin-antitoxin system Phd/YefM family antitoxin [Fenollaria timonensis]
MLAVNYSELRNNLKEYCDRAVDNIETVLVTSKDNRNVVVISLEEYNNLIEHSYIMSDAEQYKELVRRAKDVENGEHLVELKDLE